MHAYIVIDLPLLVYSIKFKYKLFAQKHACDDKTVDLCTLQWMSLGTKFVGDELPYYVRLGANRILWRHLTRIIIMVIAISIKLTLQRKIGIFGPAAFKTTTLTSKCLLEILTLTLFAWCTLSLYLDWLCWDNKKELWFSDIGSTLSFGNINKRSFRT